MRMLHAKPTRNVNQFLVMSLKMHLRSSMVVVLTDCSQTRMVIKLLILSYIYVDVLEKFKVLTLSVDVLEKCRPQHDLVNY